MKRYFLLLYFIFISVGVLSQIPRFNPGYIITLQKDTIHGYIQNGTDVELASEILFKEHSDQSGFSTYNPADLIGFVFNYGRQFKTWKSGEGEDLNFVFIKKTMSGAIDVYVWNKKYYSKPDYVLTNNYTGDTAHLEPPEKKHIMMIMGKNIHDKLQNT